MRRVLAFNLSLLLDSRIWIGVPVYAAVLVLMAVMKLVSMHVITGANEWDVALGVFDKPFSVMIMIPTGYLVLLFNTLDVDIDGWDNIVLSRGLSRTSWWVAMLISAGFEASIYMLLIVVVTACGAGVVVHTGRTWSPLDVRTHMSAAALSAHLLKRSPALIFFELVGMVWLGTWCLGTVALTMERVLRHRVLASLLGVGGGFFSYATWVVGSPLIRWAPTAQILGRALYGIGIAPHRSMTMGRSLTYEVILCFLFAIIGWIISVRRPID